VSAVARRPQTVIRRTILPGFPSQYCQPENGIGRIANGFGVEQTPFDYAQGRLLRRTKILIVSVDFCAAEVTKLA
jgi:hypothetical protein